MIPERVDYNPAVHRRLDFDNVDARQIEALGNISLKPSLTGVRYHRIPEPVSHEIKNTQAIMELFEGGDQRRAMEVLCEMVREFELRIAELEKNQNGQ